MGLLLLPGSVPNLCLRQGDPNSKQLELGMSKKLERSEVPLGQFLWACNDLSIFSTFPKFSKGNKPSLPLRNSPKISEGKHCSSAIPQKTQKKHRPVEKRRIRSSMIEENTKKDYLFEVTILQKTKNLT